MPIYEFYDKETEECFEKIISYKEREEFLKNNPNIEPVINKVGIISMVGSLDSKTDNTWKEVLNKVGEAHPGSAVANRYVKKTHKQIKTQTVLEKYRKKMDKKLHG